MRQAEDVMHHERGLREIKLVSHQQAIARWKADGPGWRHVA
jgi:hypothetical protein